MLMWHPGPSCRPFWHDERYRRVAVGILQVAPVQTPNRHPASPPECQPPAIRELVAPDDERVVHQRALPIGSGYGSSRATRRASWAACPGCSLPSRSPLGVCEMRCAKSLCIAGGSPPICRPHWGIAQREPRQGHITGKRRGHEVGHGVKQGVVLRLAPARLMASTPSHLASASPRIRASSSRTRPKCASNRSRSSDRRTTPNA